MEVHEIFTKKNKERGYIQGLCMAIGFAILPTVIGCQLPKWRQGMSVFSDSCHKWVTI